MPDSFLQGSCKEIRLKLHRALVGAAALAAGTHSACQVLPYSFYILSRLLQALQWRRMLPAIALQLAQAPVLLLISLLCRLPEVQAARTLALRDSTEGPASFSGRPYIPQAQPGPSSAHFVAECFFLTQQVIHTGLMPSGCLWLASCACHCGS